MKLSCCSGKSLRSKLNIVAAINILRLLISLLPVCSFLTIKMGIACPHIWGLSEWPEALALHTETTRSEHPLNHSIWWLTSKNKHKSKADFLLRKEKEINNDIDSIWEPKCSSYWIKLCKTLIGKDYKMNKPRTWWTLAFLGNTCKQETEAKNTREKKEKVCSIVSHYM